jgi:hypothetical protein
VVVAVVAVVTAELPQGKTPQGMLAKIQRHRGRTDNANEPTAVVVVVAAVV